MPSTFSNPIALLALAAEPAALNESASSVAGPAWFALIPLLPLAACVLCGLTVAMRVRTKAPAWITVGLLALSFVVTVAGFMGWNGGSGTPQVAKVYDWIHVAWAGADSAVHTFVADFAFYMDGLSWLWMLFVTGLATLIALYASEYMEHDVGKGYGRFFAAFALFVFAMACLVMADNLVLLYLGWEGVGLCSYLLIGYFYKKPSAVAAAKKAFIVNRIGDLGLAVGIFLTYVTFGTVEYAELFALVEKGVDGDGQALAGMWQAWAIPLLFMVGAFGKSAQLPLYVWLPDAMEGPTPVSALIHAATMVTAGVYLVARMYPLFVLEGVPHYALWAVGWTGALTALLAATIGMAQFDIKRIMAYSTVSQLGYMFAGLGVLTSVGAAFHVFTHAFFKALLFLACGAVMHGFAGQLDLRKLSGLRTMPGWRIVSITMLIGCLNLAGFPLITSGYFSKDMILAEAFVTPGAAGIGWILLVTAGLTAYYTFRVYFRVFEGPQHYEPGDELHGHDDHADDAHHHAHEHEPADHGHAHADHGGAQEHGHGSKPAHEWHPHPPKWAINGVLAVLAVLSFAAIGTYFMDKAHHGWVGGMVHRSSAEFASPFAHHDPAHGTEADGEHGHATAEAHVAAAGRFLGMDPHKAMYYVSAIVGLIGIAAAWWLHLAGRTSAATSRADALLPLLGPVPRWAQNKWYVDEFYDFIIRTPLWVLANVCHMIDRLLVDGLVNGVGLLPQLLARGLRPSQNGRLHGYAAGMAGGLAVVLLIVFLVVFSA